MELMCSRDKAIMMMSCAAAGQLAGGRAAGGRGQTDAWSKED